VFFWRSETPLRAFWTALPLLIFVAKFPFGPNLLVAEV